MDPGLAQMSWGRAILVLPDLLCDCEECEMSSQKSISQHQENRPNYIELLISQLPRNSLLRRTTDMMFDCRDINIDKI